MSKSSFPFCPFCTGTTTCPRHAEKGVPKQKKVYTIQKKSDKKKAVDKELSAFYKVLIAERPTCEIKSPECAGKAETGHHVRGRGKDHVLDTENIMSVCLRCNSYVESNDAWAREKGFLKSKLHE